MRKTIATLLLTLCISIALTRTAYNFSKLATEEREWYFLTDEEKKEKQFGEKHTFFRFVQENIEKGSNVLFYTNDGMAYYLARYYLYPTTLIWGEREFTEWGNDINRTYQYVLYFPSNKTMPNSITIRNIQYKKLTEFKYNKSVRGVIYRR